MKKITLFLLFTFVVNIGFSQFWSLEKRNHNVNKLLKKVINFSEFKTAEFAFYAVDINSGEVIAKVNPDMALKTASTMKLLSTATVLELLGPDYQFETTLEYTGKIDSDNKILSGDIIIRGGGDPTLGSKYFDSTEKNKFIIDWTKAISGLGINSVNGRIIADARAFTLDIVPPSWSWKNMGNYYGAGACGLSVYDNYYTVYLNIGNIGDTAKFVKIVPNIPNLTFDITATADSIPYDETDIFGAPYSYYRYIRGKLPANKKDFGLRGSLPDPAHISAFQLNSELKNNKITTQKTATTMRLLYGNKNFGRTKGTTFYTMLSPKLSEIIKKTNTHSINMFAEHCLIHSGIKLGALPETENSIDSVLSFWTKRGMDTQGMELHDGSGLSHYNAVTPRQFVYLLSYMKLKSKYFDAFYNSMAVAGKTGTIRRMFKGSIAEGKLRAKSGTVNRVKAYAGYVKSKSGREIAFSMVVNNFSCKSREARAKLEQLMIALAEFNK